MEKGKKVDNGFIQYLEKVGNGFQKQNKLSYVSGLLTHPVDILYFYSESQAHGGACAHITCRTKT